MFSGSNNLFRKVLPKRLFYRALLIVAVPVIVLQLVITIVFFDSLWIKTNKGMTRTLVNEISAFIEAYESEKVDKEEINNLSRKFKELKSLIYEYRDNKEQEILELKNNHNKLKDEIEINQKNYEKLIDEAADEISNFVEKANLENLS